VLSRKTSPIPYCVHHVILRQHRRVIPASCRFTVEIRKSHDTNTTIGEDPPGSTYLPTLSPLVTVEKDHRPYLPCRKIPPLRTEPWPTVRESPYFGTLHWTRGKRPNTEQLLAVQFVEPFAWATKVALLYVTGKESIRLVTVWVDTSIYHLSIRRYAARRRSFQ
jgi:hypothetical protein